MYLTYTITPTILNQIRQFSELYGALTFIPENNYWLEKLVPIVNTRNALSSVLIDKNALQKINFLSDNFSVTQIVEGERYLEFTKYQKALHKVDLLAPHKIDLEFIVELQQSILSEHEESARGFRNKVRILPKYVWENGVYKTIDLEIRTRPQAIIVKTKEFLNWLARESSQTDPLILAAICHYKIAEIHPFADANGRLARLLTRYVLFNGGLAKQDILLLEDFLLQNRERYYDLLASTIESANLTAWLEFFTEGLLSAVTNTCELLTKISAGTTDVLNRKSVQLTDREIEVLEIIRDMDQASGAEIARDLSVSRQNINVILKRLHDRGIIYKIGESTSCRYKLNS